MEKNRIRYNHPGSATLLSVVRYFNDILRQWTSQIRILELGCGSGSAKKIRYLLKKFLFNLQKIVVFFQTSCSWPGRNLELRQHCWSAFSFLLLDMGGNELDVLMHYNRYCNWTEPFWIRGNITPMRGIQALFVIRYFKLIFFLLVPRRLFFAALQRIAITWSPK